MIADDSEAYLDASDAPLFDPSAKLWAVLSECRACAGQLNALHNSEATGALIESAKKAVASAAATSETGQGTTDVDKDIEILRLRGELEECRDDLKRDEEIFAEKVKELKKYKKEAKKLTTENVSLKMTLQATQAALAAETTRRHVDVTSAPSGQTTSRRVASSRDDDMEAARDIEISSAVAATEPDISQLMEELEVVSREKEQLHREKLLADEKAKEVQQLADAEKEQFAKSKDGMQRRLRELEIGMRLKQVRCFPL